MNPLPVINDSARASMAVVVPAASESVVIARLIKTLADQQFVGTVAIVIAVNGARDNTAAIARARIDEFVPRSTWCWRVLELPVPSKSRALNEGERIARSLLRSLGVESPDITFYLDADIELSPNTFDEVASVLSDVRPRIVQPFRCAEASAPFLSWMAGNALCTLPWVTGDIACGGVFAVNRAGRERWTEFPDLAADDAFVFNRFRSEERVVVTSARATHPMPATLRGLARQQRRWRLARKELEASGVPSAFPCDAASSWPMRRRIKAMLSSPRVLLSFVGLRAIRVASYFDRTHFRSHVWEVDRVGSTQNKHSMKMRGHDAARS